jgi:hypothetical protein
MGDTAMEESQQSELNEEVIECDPAETSLWESLHDAILIRITSAPRQRKIDFEFRINHLCKFHQLPINTTFLLQFEGVDFVRVAEDAPWPNKPYDALFKIITNQEISLPAMSARLGDEDIPWHKFEEQLNAEKDTEVYEASITQCEDGRLLFRLGIHVFPEFWPGLNIYAQSFSIQKTESEMLSLEEFLQLGVDFWEAFEARSRARMARNAESK